MGIFIQFYFYSDLQIVEVIEGQWLSIRWGFLFPSVNSFVSQFEGICRHHLTLMCSRVSLEWNWWEIACQYHLGSGETKLWQLESDSFPFFCYQFRIWMKQGKREKDSSNNRKVKFQSHWIFALDPLMWNISYVNKIWCFDRVRSNPALFCGLYFNFSTIPKFWHLNSIIQLVWRTKTYKNYQEIISMFNATFVFICLPVWLFKNEWEGNH